MADSTSFIILWKVWEFTYIEYTLFLSGSSVRARLKGIRSPWRQYGCRDPVRIYHGDFGYKGDGNLQNRSPFRGYVLSKFSVSHLLNIKKVILLLMYNLYNYFTTHTRGKNQTSEKRWISVLDHRLLGSRCYRLWHLQKSTLNNTDL